MLHTPFPVAPRASATLGPRPSHQHLDLLLQEVDLVLLLNQLLLLLGDLGRHGVDKGIKDGLARALLRRLSQLTPDFPRRPSREPGDRAERQGTEQSARGQS